MKCIYSAAVVLNLFVAVSLIAAAEPLEMKAAGELKANVGKLVTLEGSWSDLGKIGPFVALDRGGSVYLEGSAVQRNRVYGVWNGRRTRIVGTLRLFEIPAAKRAASLKETADAPIAMPPDYFYISIDDLKVKDLAHPEAGFQLARHKPTRGDSPFMLYQHWRKMHGGPQSAANLAACRPNPAPDPRDPHAGGLVNLYVNPTGADSYGGGAKPLPRGTVIVKEKLASGSTAEAVELGVMIKRDLGFDPAAGDWEFLFAEGKKPVVYQRELTANCRACHATRASSDYVFRAGLAKTPQR